jgi:hypothetical protein
VHKTTQIDYTAIVLSVTKRAKYKGKYNNLWLAVTFIMVVKIGDDKITLYGYKRSFYRCFVSKNSIFFLRRGLFQLL